MRILLGGTAMLGREVAQLALDRGHDVTCLARGTGVPPGGVELVAADRELDDALSAVAQIHWDAVVDVSRQPGHVRRAVRGLRTNHWTLVSSGNACADFSQIEQDEDAPTLAPLTGDVMESIETYGSAEVACEELVRNADGPAALVRSGLIGGRGDSTGRTGYWPWRFAKPTGDDVIVPDDLDFPCAVIDVRDLAKWIVICAETRSSALDRRSWMARIRHYEDRACPRAGTHHATARRDALRRPRIRAQPS